MKHPLRWMSAAAGIAFVALLPSSVTIVRGGERAEQQAADSFDPVAYVDDIWDSQLLPMVESDAQELATVLDAMDVDDRRFGQTEQLAAVAEQYGSITVGEAHVYLVRGAGTVIEVDDRGLMTVQLDGYDGPIAVAIYMGTRIPSDETAVRDAVGFISFGDFKEQTEYGKVGNEINKRIVREVITPFAEVELAGERIAFLGATSIRTFNLVQIDLTAVRVVPVQIEQAG